MRGPTSVETGSLVLDRVAEVAAKDVAEVVEVLDCRSGWSSPSWCRTACTSCCGAFGPSAIRTGSPGTRWISMNETNESARRTTSDCAPRRPS